MSYFSSQCPILKNLHLHGHCSVPSINSKSERYASSIISQIYYAVFLWNSVWTLRKCPKIPAIFVVENVVLFAFRMNVHKVQICLVCLIHCCLQLHLCFVRLSEWIHQCYITNWRFEQRTFSVKRKKSRGLWVKLVFLWLNCFDLSYQGADPFFLLAGPNVIESEEHILRMAKHMKSITSKYAISIRD